ncbi:heme ABC transporter permease [Psychrobium sp. 1_MG-2023]|uniref:heme ABC transporter permease n=1 Tax=Psychrobium sp. 1_MG-2023 TaxID=3062624 RepID=UPI000C33FA5A|nr:heme ABC transporter permease [Psychrobium sp. 1_MG-2023]MDP2562633.1 heme ABC transporter permease [Psychrobium sp. 1_MG-2023]PKF54389.1 heme ABC transporter permease [Alteromonadales bacterium alter-6D02]
MWKWLHPYAKPERSYQLASTLLPWFSVLSITTLLIGIIWALGFAPVDYQQGESYRIIYVHVPAATLSMSVYMAMATAALVSMVWQLKLADAAAAAMAPIGAVLTTIALITGAAWGKPMWGTWWVWDARLTSELILLFLYLGIIALHNAFDDKVLAGRAAGILTLVGVVNIPIIKYSVEWWNTLHQGATISKLDKPSMSTDMLLPLLVNILGFVLMIGAITLIRFRNEVIARNAMRPWVKELIAKELK